MHCLNVACFYISCATFFVLAARFWLARYGSVEFSPTFRAILTNWLPIEIIFKLYDRSDWFRNRPRGLAPRNKKEIGDKAGEKISGPLQHRRGGQRRFFSNCATPRRKEKGLEAVDFGAYRSAVATFLRSFFVEREIICGERVCQKENVNMGKSAYLVQFILTGRRCSDKSTDVKVERFVS